MKKIIVCMFAVFALKAQTLNVAETSGKGKVGLFVGTNALLVKNFTTAAYSWVALTYGVNDRTDVCTCIASTTALGQTQNAAMAGWNVNLWKKGVSVSNFTLASTPVHKRQQSSEAVLFSAVVVSKNLGWFTPYSGYSVTAPIGDRQNKLFTGTSAAHNVPVGVMIPRGKFAYFAEYNFGKAVKTAGFGLAYTF